MGLDTVELVMEIEDEFHITIADADAQLIETADQLHAYVCQQIRPRPAPVCASARAFYHLRQIFLAHSPSARRTVRPSARIAHLLPEDFRDHWPGIAGALRLRAYYSFDNKAPLRFPAVFTTVRDLIRKMTFPQPFDLPAIGGDFEESVWQLVRKIISKQAGVSADEVHKHTHFINDLNLE